MRIAFLWLAAMVATLAFVASPIIDIQKRPNYRAVASAGSTDLLALGSETDLVLAAAYGLPRAVRDFAPHAQLVVPAWHGGADWTLYRVAALGDVAGVTTGPGTVDDWLAGSDLSQYVVAAGQHAGHINSWTLALDPAGDHKRLALVTTMSSRGVAHTWVVETSLLPGLPAVVMQ